MAKWVKRLSWAWVIIIGGWMITPGGIECIACGPLGTKILGAISIALGVAGFVADVQKTAAVSQTAAP